MAGLFSSNILWFHKHSERHLAQAYIHFRSLSFALPLFKYCGYMNVNFLSLNLIYSTVSSFVFVFLLLALDRRCFVRQFLQFIHSVVFHSPWLLVHVSTLLNKISFLLFILSFCVCGIGKVFIFLFIIIIL